MYLVTNWIRDTDGNYYSVLFYNLFEYWNIARGSAAGSSGEQRGSRGQSVKAETEKAVKDARRGSEGRRQSAGKGERGSMGGMGKKKSVEMSKESKLKQKKADEAALRKNKVIA